MRPILVFDSGFGGLSVVRALRKLQPELPVDYAADFAFFPYGDKPDAALAARLPKLLAHLSRLTQPSVIVLACNTASTLALENVRGLIDVPVVGTVPAIKPAAKRSKSGVIGLLATPATIGRIYTNDLIAEFASNIEVIKIGSTALVEMAEAHLAGHTINPRNLWQEQSAFFMRKIPVDTIVLGCTHFPHIQHQLAAATYAHGFMPEYIDPSEAIAKQALRVLGRVDDDAHAPTNTSQSGRAYSTAGLPLHKQKVFSQFAYADITITRHA